MKKLNKIISMMLTVAMLMSLMTSVSFAAQTLPTVFGWSAENAGYITIDVPAFDGEEVEYYLDLYKDGTKVNHDFGVFFDANGMCQTDVFVDKINELGDGTYKYKIGLSRDFETDELVNPTAFSSEYVKTSGGTLSDLPYDLSWNPSKPGNIQFAVPEHIEGKVKYKIVLYKGTEKIADTTLSVWGNTLDASRIMTHSCMADDIYDHGSGIYKYKLSTLDSSNNVLETTDFSSEFNYVKPSATLPVPTGIVLTESEVRWTPISSEYCGGYWIDFYVAYPNGEKFWVYGEEERGKDSSSANYLEDNDVATYSSQQIDRMYGINATKYPKESAFLAVTMQSLTSNMLACNSSDISGYVSAVGGGNNDDSTTGTQVDRTGVSAEYYDAAKVMYDLGIMPDVYTNCKSNVKESEFYEIINRIKMGSISTGTDDIAIEDVAKKIIGILGYSPMVNMNEAGDIFYTALRCGMLDDVGNVWIGGSITHEQLAQILYNSLSLGIMEQVASNEYNTTDKTILTKYLDIAKITATITINGNNASVSGLKYDKDNLKGIEISNVSTGIEDSDIFGYADGNLILYVKNNKIVSGLKYDSPFFIINGGATETENTNLSLSLYAKGYTKYKFVDGNESDSDIPYTPITSNSVSHTISSEDGKHTVKIQFANANESVTKIASSTITLNNKQNITFVANGSVIKTEQQGCGKYITFPRINIDGYWLKGWSVPADYIIPDKDITVTAELVPLATIKGKLIDIDGEPVGYGNPVSVWTDKDYGNNNGYVSSYTNEQGVFEIVCPQGEYLLQVVFNGRGRTVEVTANQAVVELGEIRETVILPTVSVQYQVENVKGFLGVHESLVTEEELASVPEGGRYLVSCSAGARLVIEDSADIAQTIRTDCGADAPVYYVHIGLDKQIKTARGDYENYASIYNTPELLEFVINIPDEVKGKNEYVIYREHTTQAEDGTTTVIEKITTEANEFGEYLSVADDKISLFAKRFSDCGTYGIVGIGEAAPEQPVYSSGGGGRGSGSTTVSVPSSAGTDVKATVSGTTATISNIDTSKATDETAYSIDMSGVNKTIKSVKLPASAVKDLTKEESTVESLDIKLSSGSVSFDAEALKTIAAEAKGGQITLNIDSAAVRLTATEKNAIKEISSPMIVDVSLSSNNKNISDFKGGKAVVSVPYELKDGQIAESVVARHIGGNGVLTAMETEYDEESKTVSFVVPHFSKYVISAAYEKDAIILNIGEKEAKVFGEAVSNDVAPKLVNDRTMLPIRFIAEKLGAEVGWAQETETVTVELGDIRISLVIGEGFATVNDEKIELDSPSFVENNRTFLPIRFVMENLGADVMWNNDTQTVTIIK